MPDKAKRGNRTATVRAASGYGDEATGVNLRQWRLNPNGWWKDYCRHDQSGNTLWYDGHVSMIKESTGEDVPLEWYRGW